MSTLKAACHSLLRSVGLEVHRYRPQTESSARTLTPFECRRLQFIRAHNIDMVLDVGANEGQFAQTLRQSGYTGRIVSFEPVPTAFTKLKANAAADPKWEVIQCGVGEAAGFIEINVGGTTDCSSFLDMSERHLVSYPASAYVGTEKVKLVTLDSICGDLFDAKQRVYLKMDVQGFEMQVLLGARTMLSQVQVVESEMCLTELYIGQALIGDITNFLYQTGYDLAALEDGGIEAESGHMLWAEGIFVRRNAEHQQSN